MFPCCLSATSGIQKYAVSECRASSQLQFLLLEELGWSHRKVDMIYSSFLAGTWCPVQQHTNFPCYNPLAELIENKQVHLPQLYLVCLQMPNPLLKFFLKKVVQRGEHLRKLWGLSPELNLTSCNEVNFNVSSHSFYTKHQKRAQALCLSGWPRPEASYCLVAGRPLADTLRTRAAGS